MNYFKYVLLFLIVTFTVTAQDTIQFKDKEVRVVKVTEIGVDEIKYYQFNNLDGPIHIAYKSEVNYIKYSNGNIDTFRVEKPLSIQVITKSQNQIYFSRGSLIFHDNRIDIIETLLITEEFAKKINNTELSILTSKTRVNNSLQNTFSICGITNFVTAGALFLVSVGTLLIAGIDYATVPFYIGGGFTVLGLGFIASSIVNGTLKHKRLQKTVRLYNQFAD